MRSVSSSLESTRLGSRTARLPWAHLGSIGLGQGLLLGRANTSSRSPPPRAFAWRLQACFQARTSALLCQAALSQMSGGHLPACSLQALANPGRKLAGDAAHRPPLDKAQEHPLLLLLLLRLLLLLLLLLLVGQVKPVTGDRLGGSVMPCALLLPKPQGLLWLAPGTHGRSGKPAPPHLTSSKPRLQQGCSRALPISRSRRFFLRAQAGSGLPIQCPGPRK